MALLDFPTGPQLNDTTTQNGNTWKWNGTSWVAFNNLSLTSQVTGVLGTVYGGTGKALSGLTVGSVLYADSSTSFAALAPSTNNYVLATQGAGNPPYWKVDDSGTGSVGSGTTGGFAYYTGLNSITSGSGFSLIPGSGNGGTIIFTNGILSLIGSTINAGTWAGSAITLAYGGTNNNVSGIGHSFRVAIYDAAGTAITNISSVGTANSILLQQNQQSAPAWVGQNTLVVGGATTAGITTNIGGGGAGSIPFNTAASTTTFLSHSGAGGSILVTLGTTGVGWTAGSNLSVGSATNATNLNVNSANGIGVSYLLFAGGTSGNQPVYTATGITVSAVNSALYATNLVASGTTLSTSTSTGALVVAGGVGIGGSLWTSANNFSSISGVGHSNGVITSGSWAGNAITLLYGGTNGTNSGIALSYQLAVYNNTGTAITQILSSSGTANSILLQSAQNAMPQWVGQNTLVVGGATTAAMASTSAYVVTESSTATRYLVGTPLNSAASGATLSVGSGITIGNNRLTATDIVATNFTGSGANLTSVVNSLSAGNSYISVSATTGSIFVNNIGVQSLTGTANQILVAGGSGVANTGTITLTLPNSVQVANLVLTDGATSTLANVGPNPTSMVNKQYVDNLASGLDIHASVRVVQTTAIGASYLQTQAAGTAATGAFLISTSQVALPAIDGVTFTATGATQRILIAGGATGGTKINGSATWVTPVNQNIFNGIYFVGALGGAGTSNWILVRATDTDDSSELTAGTFTFVEEGDVYKDTGWVCTNDTTNLGPIQFGLDNSSTGVINFSQFTGAQALNIGQGLTRIGNTIGVNANITPFGPATLLPNSGSGYSSFSIGGYISGIAGTSYTATLRVGTGNTYGLGTANIVLNHTGFSMSGGTNSTKTVTITGDISIPSPTQYGIAYGADTSTLAFTSAAAGLGASVLTQTINNNPVYLGQSQLLVGSATTAAYVVTDSSTVTRYLIGALSNSAATGTTLYVGSGITIGNNLLTSGGIAVTGTTPATSVTSGALVVTGGVGIGSSLWTSPSYFSSISGIGHSNGVITSGSWAGNAITLLYGGTNGTNSGIALSYQLAVYNNSGTAITQILSSASTGNSILLQSAQNAMPQWVGQNTLVVGGATTAAIATTTAYVTTELSTATRYLVGTPLNSASTGATLSVGSGITIGNNRLSAENLVALGATISTSTTTGALIVNGGVGIGGSLWTGSANYSQISGLGIISGIVTSGLWAGTAISLINGGTNNTIAGNGHSNKVAVYNASGSAITAYTITQGNIIFGATGGTYAGLASTLIPVTAISDSPPAQPGGAIGGTQSGQLWWDSQYGALKVYYNDGNTSQWVDATPVLGSSGGGSSVKRSYVMTFGAGFTPSSGADTVQIQVPYAPDNTSKYYYIKRLDYRNETTSSGTGVSFHIDRHTTGNFAFAVANRIHTIGAGAASSFIASAGAFTTTYVLAGTGLSFASSSGVAASILSGDYLRLNFTNIGGAATMSVSMIIEEQ